MSFDHLLWSSTRFTLRPRTLQFRSSNSFLSEANVPEFGRTDRGEVLWVREEDCPTVANPLVEVDDARRRLGGEVRRPAIDPHGHGILRSGFLLVRGTEESSAAHHLRMRRARETPPKRFRNVEASRGSASRPPPDAARPATFDGGEPSHGLGAPDERSRDFACGALAGRKPVEAAIELLDVEARPLGLRECEFLPMTLDEGGPPRGAASSLGDRQTTCAQHVGTEPIALAGRCRPRRSAACLVVPLGLRALPPQLCTRDPSGRRRL